MSLTGLNSRKLGLNSLNSFLNDTKSRLAARALLYILYSWAHILLVEVFIAYALQLFSIPCTL